MAESFRRFDAADYLETPEDTQAYLDAAAEDGDPAVLAAALGAVARARNMAQLARETGMTREGLYKALSPGGNPAFGTVAKVARALGFALAFRPTATKTARAPRQRAAVKRKGAA
jgi:probable addiction module antidote protein